MQRLVSLAKRRGFVFPSSELYGGLQGFWDWGPLGVELKNNIKREWWKRFVQNRGDVVGLDSAIITNPEVWEKSGHTQVFQDKLLECRECHQRFRDVDISTVDGTGGSCPNCSSRNFEPAKEFNLLFETRVGPVFDSKSTAYLRPETAQNIFVNFENIVSSTRAKVPFGIAQIGKAFRNEITPGNFIFRSREFEQMELEYFVREKEANTSFDFWVDESLAFYSDLGIKKKNLRKREQSKAELAHYAKATTDLEYRWPFSGGAGSALGGDKGWAELTGIANRGDFDLKNHGQIFKDESGSFVPWVIEPSFGVERAALAFLLDAYHVVEGGRSTTKEAIKEEEVVLRLHKNLAPIKVAVLPLSKKPELQKIAESIAQTLRSKWMVMYDETASIGKRYRRQDEIGTPYCVTVDFDSVEDKKVTVRDRDSMLQERVPVAELVLHLSKELTS